MSSTVKSTVTFGSNIYPVAAEQILYDEEFLHSLRDPIAVREFKKRASRYHPSSLQNDILNAGVGVECTYSETGDLVWGTVIEDGAEKVACRCENYACALFSQCRPGVEVPQIPVIEDKVAVEEFLNEFAPDEENVFTEADQTDDADPVSEETPETVFKFESDSYSEAVEDRFSEELREEFFSEAETAEDASLDENDCLADFANSAKPVLDLPAFETIAGRYDERQAEIVCANPDDRIYVNAGPGSGKTHTLIEKIKYLLEDQMMEPDCITVLSFTRAAVAVVRGRLKVAAENGEIHGMWQDVDVTTFDKLCTRLLYFAAREPDDKIAEKSISKLNYEQRIVEATKLIELDPSLLEGCEHLIVDETQDLVGVRADLVTAMLANIPSSCGFTLFGDRCQSVYEYQVKDGGTTPSEFYKDVRAKHKPREIYLEKNYRQKPSYPLDLTEMRASLLEENVEQSGKLIAQAAVALGMPAQTMRMLDPKAILHTESQGSMGILTRKNDEALEIESLLWKLGIPVIHGRSDAGEAITRCIADAFTRCEGQTISEEEFEKLIASKDPYGDGRIWRAMLSLDGISPEGDRLRISNVLSALQGAVLSPELAALREDESGIAVSTVHASKGREFDTVWMLAENLADFANADEPEEKRVAYVGLTRGAGSVELQCLDEHFLAGGKSSFYTCKMFDKDRYFRKNSGRGKRKSKPRVVNVEIRNEMDVDFEEFRKLGKVQKMLSEQPMEGAPIRLVLSGSGDLAYYKIVLQDNEDMVLGRMKRTFLDDYRRCAGGKDIESVTLPDAFDELYIDRVISCVGRSVPEAMCDISFDSMAVWYGFTIGGYAHRDDTQGY